MKSVPLIAIVVLLSWLPGGAVVAGQGVLPGDGSTCACSRGLFPMCSSTTGGYVASSADCAERCAGITDSVQCIFLRYFSWRRKCNCSLNLPERIGGMCDIESGIVVSKDEECAQCRKLNESSYDSCDDLADVGVTPRLPPAIYEIDLQVNQDGNTTVDADDCSEKGKKPKFCGEEWDKLPACNMVTGHPVADSGCQAGADGHTYTMPCKYLSNKTTDGDFFPEDCLFGETAPNFVGRVAGYTGCQAVIHMCHVRWLRRDGALTHALCVESPGCAEEAKQVVDMWPQCGKILKSGGGSCSALRAKQVFDNAVQAVCRPFGMEDFQ